ncbi:hypothetical protein I7I53_04699 [Histoplasma capsulatum var. duboisii H88]|uniref:Uncharacterized protein n=2 Tax=Ajellomyces capsulatus TaxID=5037 RepID=A0A8H7YCX3_AJECA|nr:hypothetical protein I7I52_12330 [Histoplasma capsulatum]QSS56477.1 hypothetical protein I7I53_04699 [Histoplasma capsulatum var. duboisii H88]QSS71324.1 hypothetical protein I7I50_02116 [Histoplasma capsulatum G186AR]
MHEAVIYINLPGELPASRDPAGPQPVDFNTSSSFTLANLQGFLFVHVDTNIFETVYTKNLA